jgi:citrate lyase beta subunit
VPGDRPERHAKALATAADRVVLELEGAVLPDAKPVTRERVAQWLVGPEAQDVAVRINGVDTPCSAERRVGNRDRAEPGGD